jgi:hypothetical protein
VEVVVIGPLPPLAMVVVVRPADERAGVLTALLAVELVLPPVEISGLRQELLLEGKTVTSPVEETDESHITMLI